MIEPEPGFRWRLDELLSNLRQGALYLARLTAQKVRAKNLQVDKSILVDIISENTSATGVTIDSLLVKDGAHGQITGTGDLHTEYQKESEKDAASGYAGLTAGTKLNLTQMQEVITQTDLADTVIASPVKNQALLFNGTLWVNAAQGMTWTFSIASFTWSGYTATIEIGTGIWKAVAALSFTATYNNGPPDATPYVDKTSPGWAANLLMTTAPLYEGPTLNTEAVNYPAVNGTRVFTLYAQVGSEADTEVKTTTFKNKKYFGFHDDGTKLDSAKTKTLSNNGWVGSTPNDLDTPSTLLTPVSGFEYVHFVYPSRLDPSSLKFYIGGFETDFTDLGTFTFTNNSGYAETYRDYVSPQSYDVAVSLVVEATP